MKTFLTRVMARHKRLVRDKSNARKEKTTIGEWTNVGRELSGGETPRVNAGAKQD
jgi:hypothetical protein